MEWEEFLKHPKVVSDTKDNVDEPPGEYLYKKMLHDMLECLNGYKDFIKVASLMQNIPDNIQDWFLKWKPSNETWISSLTVLSEHYYRGKPPNIITDWPHLIAHLANIPIEISLQHAEAQQLTIPLKGSSADLIKNAIASIARLNLICSYIQNQDYIRLWTTDY